MANVETALDLVQYVEEGMGEASDGTSPYRAKALTQLNRCYKALIAGGAELNTGKKPIAFPWARAQWPVVVNLEAPITTGTAAPTVGSTSVALSDAPAASVAGWMISFTGEATVYRVAAHTGGSTSVTLDAAYVGAWTTGVAYTLFKLHYAYAGVFVPLSPLRIYVNQWGNDARRQIFIVDEAALDAQWPMSLVEEMTPTRAAVVYQSGTTLTLKFNGYPGSVMRTELDYIADPAALTIGGADPIVPKAHRVVLAEWALGLLLEEKDDDRASTHITLAKAEFEALVREARGMTTVADPNYGRVVPVEREMVSTADLLRTTDGFLITG